MRLAIPLFQGASILPAVTAMLFDIYQESWHIALARNEGLFINERPRYFKVYYVSSPAHLPNTHHTCSNCNLVELCLPTNLNPDEVERLNELNATRRNYSRGDYLYRSGDKFRSLYAIHSGSFKTQILHDDGREQVTGFQMAGEIIGLDAISTDIHACDAVAMEPSVVCEIPFNRLEALSREIPMLQRQLHKLMSREIVRDQGIMLLLGSMRAEERLAAFLLNLSQRFAARGLSPTQFTLRMSRQEIGSYLGLKLETVSRTFSSLQQRGIISIHIKSLQILDLQELRNCISSSV